MGRYGESELAADSHNSQSSDGAALARKGYPAASLVASGLRQIWNLDFLMASSILIFQPAKKNVSYNIIQM